MARKPIAGIVDSNVPSQLDPEDLAAEVELVAVRDKPLFALLFTNIKVALDVVGNKAGGNLMEGILPERPAFGAPYINAMTRVGPPVAPLILVTPTTMVAPLV